MGVSNCCNNLCKSKASEVLHADAAFKSSVDAGATNVALYRGLLMSFVNDKTA